MIIIIIARFPRIVLPRRRRPDRDFRRRSHHARARTLFVPTRIYEIPGRDFIPSLLGSRVKTLRARCSRDFPFFWGPTPALQLPSSCTTPPSAGHATHSKSTRRPLSYFDRRASRSRLPALARGRASLMTPILPFDDSCAQKDLRLLKSTDAPSLLSYSDG